MRTYALLAVALLLAPPGAAAWEARFVAAPSEVSLAASLLLAGAVHASAPSGGFFGAPHAQRLLFDAPVAVRFCPDQAGEPQSSPQCPGGSGTTGARLYVRSGGLVAFAPDGELNLSTRASAAALGGPNVTLNKRAVGAGVYVGGNAVVTSTGGALVVRPLLPNASIEVRGDDGFFTYNGTAYTLVVSGGFNESRLEARGAFLAAPDIDVRVERAGLREAEAHLRVEELFTTLRALQPAERADRRAAVAGAFGLFQLVPALLDGAAATRANLTLNDEARSEFTFVRLSDARFGHDGANWTGSGNATYMTDAAVLAPHPDAHVRFPVLVPLVLIGGAIVARVLTYRAPAPRRRRTGAHAIRAGGVLVLALLVATTLAPLLGFSPLLDAPSLGLRSRVQLALLVLGMVLSAYVAIGIPSESLARSAFAWRDRPRALLVPAAVGVAASAAFVLLATPILLSFVARFVRL